MTDSDRVNVVRAMAERTPFSERAKELPADTEGREFPKYLTYRRLPNNRLVQITALVLITAHGPLFANLVSLIYIEFADLLISFTTSITTTAHHAPILTLP